MRISSALEREWIKQGKYPGYTRVTSQICCLLEGSQWSCTLITPVQLSSACQAGGLGKVPPSPPGCRTLQAGEQLGGAMPHLPRGGVVSKGVLIQGLPCPTSLVPHLLVCWVLH